MPYPNTQLIQTRSSIYFWPKVLPQVWQRCNFPLYVACFFSFLFFFAWTLKRVSLLLSLSSRGILRHVRTLSRWAQTRSRAVLGRGLNFSSSNLKTCPRIAVAGFLLLQLASLFLPRNTYYSYVTFSLFNVSICHFQILLSHNFFKFVNRFFLLPSVSVVCPFLLPLA